VRRDDPPGRILPAVIESGHSRFPVMDENRDDIVGILLAKDLLRLAPQANEAHEGGAASAASRAAAATRFDIREYMRPAVFVPESKRLNVLLRDFRRGRNHMAIVVDEYGGVSGLVTIEDVIEEIVGEIEDEFDVEDDRNIRKEEPRQFTVRGVTRLEEFNEYFGTELTGDGFDTIAGLVMNRLGRLPRRGETLAVDGLEFRVMRADRRRIDTVRVVSARDVTPPDERAADGAE
jgi:magnesium and cobalt transporter